MTPHQTVAVALRLFAVWIGLQALRTVPAFFMPNAIDPSGYVYALFMLALTVALILIMWFFPRVITGNLLPPQEAQSQPSATPDTWLAVGCSLLGLWVLTMVAPRAAFDVFALNSMERFVDHRDLLRGVIYDVLELAIAVCLILGGMGFRKLFWWAQNAGVRKDL